jgi:hypothetical protein
VMAKVVANMSFAVATSGKAGVCSSISYVLFLPNLVSHLELRSGDICFGCQAEKKRFKIDYTVLHDFTKIERNLTHTPTVCPWCSSNSNSSQHRTSWHQNHSTRMDRVPMLWKRQQCRTWQLA